MAFDGQAGNRLSGGYGDASSGLDEFIPEIWGAALQESFDKKLVMAGLGTDWSSLVATSGDYIRLPLVEDMGVGTSTTANALATAISYTDATANAGKLAITINQHSYSAAMVEDLTVVQSSYDLFSTFTERMAAALALTVDDYLENLVNTALDDSGTQDGQTIDGGGTAAAIDQVGLQNIIAAVIAEDASLDNWFIVCNASGYSKLFAIDEFIQGYSVGNPQGGMAPPVVNGLVGLLGGMKVIYSNNIQTSYTAGGSGENIAGYVMHKSALHYAFSIRPRVQTQYDIDFIATKLVADVAYGGAVKGSLTAGEKTVFAII